MVDHTRFEEPVLPHLDAAYNLARWLMRDVSDAEDVVQDARALKYVDSLNGGGARAWFLTTVRRAFYNWYKRNRPADIAPDDGTAIEVAVDPAAVNPEQAFCARLSPRRWSTRSRRCRWPIAKY